jgi:hypothetical protein
MSMNGRPVQSFETHPLNVNFFNFCYYLIKKLIWEIFDWNLRTTNWFEIWFGYKICLWTDGGCKPAKCEQKSISSQINCLMVHGSTLKKKF